MNRSEKRAAARKPATPPALPPPGQIITIEQWYLSIRQGLDAIAKACEMVVGVFPKLEARVKELEAENAKLKPPEAKAA